jgi:hypothetical protein
MAALMTLQDEHTIKASYFNLLASFFEQDSIPTAHVKCLIKWGVQLGINPQDIDKLGSGLTPSFTFPKDDIGKLESVYHLVHMIYLDQVVEDVELEVATIFGERLGFKKSLVADVFKSIATSDFDKLSEADVRKEVTDFLKMQNS